MKFDQDKSDSGSASTITLLTYMMYDCTM